MKVDATFHIFGHVTVDVDEYDSDAIYDALQEWYENADSLEIGEHVGGAIELSNFRKERF